MTPIQIFVASLLGLALVLTAGIYFLVRYDRS